MNVVYDTSALLNRFNFNDVEFAYITNSVISEIRDFEHRQILENKISKGILKIEEPSNSALDIAEKIAKRTNLSSTDIEVLALAFDLNAKLVSDDATLLNCATKVGLLVENVLYSNNFDENKINEIYKKIYIKIEPEKKEMKELDRISGLIVKELNNSASKLNLPVKKILLAGSASRKTYIRNNKDLDIFVLFDLKVDEKSLEELNTDIIANAFPGINLTKAYSQHPYYQTKLFGYDVEFVPGYFIENIKDKKSAVDRTPLHLAYLNENFDDKLRKDVILFKQFLKNNLLYGADLKYNGMPGYLVELLIMHYNGLNNLLKAISYWDKRVLIDVKKHYIGNVKFNDSLIVIDPTDPERNVASAFSQDNFEMLKIIVKQFLEKPSIKFFYGNEYLSFYNKKALDKSIVLSFNSGSYKTEDSKYGALHSKLVKLERKAKERNVVFDYKSLVISKEAYFILSINNDEIVKKGPMLIDKENVKQFKLKNKDSFVKDGRVYTKVNLTKVEKINIIKELLEELNIKSKRIQIKNFLEKIKGENKKILYKDFSIYN